MVELVPVIDQFVAQVKAEGFTGVIVIGMGDSTVVANVLSTACDRLPDGLPIYILDTRDLTKIRRIEQQIDLATTLFVVTSKSGITAEPLVYTDYFLAKVREVKGDRAGENFVAVTDLGTGHEVAARTAGYRTIFPNFPQIEGRYSALCAFGLLPGALYGFNVGQLLERAIRMQRAAGAYDVGAGEERDNPAFRLASLLLALSSEGRSLLTLLVPPSLSQFGRWIRKTVAASALRTRIAVEEEPLLTSQQYSSERAFILVDYAADPDAALARKRSELEALGHPTLSFYLDTCLDIGQEFARWEAAIAIAESHQSIRKAYVA